MTTFTTDGRQSCLLARCCAALLLVFALFVSGPGVAAAQKTVHVKEYTRKDGTTVKAHDRKAPEKKSTNSAAETETSRKESSVETASGVTRDERGRIQRSAAARHAFARQTGYPNGRPGYVVDHIVPLACGGADEPSNMQWQTAADVMPPGSPYAAEYTATRAGVQSPPKYWDSWV